MAAPRKNYAARLNQHLAEYKQETLRLSTSGTWTYRGRAIHYPHILPADQWDLNLLPAYRQQCATYLATVSPTVHKHQYFHHLNSSQAMCFNLFFPFVHDKSLMPLLLDVLRLPNGAATGQFEKVFDTEENTNFDFFLEYSDGNKTFFELKLSEQGFGTADKRKWEEKYRAKFARYYQPLLAGFVPDKWLDPESFCNHYQILRNISYLNRHPGSKLLFIYPMANNGLAKDGKAIQELADMSALKGRIAIVHLETLVSQLSVRVELDNDLLQTQLKDFKLKYMKPDSRTITSAAGIN